VPPQQYDRGNKLGTRFSLKGGINTVDSRDILPEGQYAYLANVRGYLGTERITARAPQTEAVATMGSGPVHSLRRLNDSTPAGPGSGFSLVGGSGTSLYNNSTAVASGLSGNPLSLVPFRPNTSVQPWEYVGDSSTAVTITTGSFGCAGMLKVRSDGRTRKTGIAEPQAFPTVTFPGGGGGPAQLFYRYVYRASETGALSNPSPDSVPGSNSQANPSKSISATAFATNYTFNAAQWEYSAPQLRTKSPTALGTLDFVTVKTGSTPFAIPDGVNIDGVLIDLNWVGQNAGTGTLSSAALYYLGNQIGNAKFPGVQNQSFSADTFVGGSADNWGAALTPDIINDPSFGFGVQITKQNSGGSDRSFINFMSITVYYSTQNAVITPTASSDPQVDKIDIYRQGGGLANFTYVGTTPNSATAFTDTLSDLGAATNPQLQFDNFEPFPSIDLPRSGVINVTSNVLTYVSGDHFNIRWLPGTIIQIGSPTQLSYSATRRPTSTTSWDFTNNDPSVAAIPDGTNLAWNIAEPILAAQPLPSLWGPTDNTAYMFGCFDPLRPGTLYYTKGNNPDSAPDTNQIEVTSPSEPLMNGVIVNGLGMVFTSERAWLIYPTFTTALATVNGVEGQAFNLIESITDRGLYIRSAICTEAGKRVFFRAKDGIYVSVGGSGSQSITNATIYNLFPHEGHTPTAVTIAGQVISPPDDAQPEKQKLRFATGYLYYDYIGLDSNPHTLVFDVEGEGWIVDLYQHSVTTHALAEGPNVNGVMVGCSDGTVRNLATGGSETGVSAIVATGSNTFGDARAFQRIGDIFVKAAPTNGHPISVQIWTDQYQTNLASGFSPTSLTGSSYGPYIVDFTAGGGLDANDIALVLSWDINSTNYLDLWQPDIINLPETTQDRVTDWDDAGTPGNKFFIGALLECDTFNTPKAIAVEDELGVLHIPNESPITANGQSVKVLTFTPPFTAHLVRIVSTDGVPWRVWPTGDGTAQWDAKPYPEAATVWNTEAGTNNLDGYQHIFQVNLAYIATAPVTLTLNTDQGIFTQHWPATSTASLQPAKILLKMPSNKFKVVSYSVISTAPVYLWKDQTEVWIKQWDSQDAYVKITPFGGASGSGAEV
jgi:hypothetical protein